MSPSLLNTGLALALTEGNISSSSPGDRIRCLGQAVLLDHSTGPVSPPSLLHEGTEDTSAPASIKSRVSSQQQQHAGEHQGCTTPTHPAPLLHGDLLLSSFQCVLFMPQAFPKQVSEKYLSWPIAFGRTREAFIS